jgi:hypothetical protein
MFGDVGSFARPATDVKPDGISADNFRYASRPIGMTSL